MSDVKQAPPFRITQAEQTNPLWGKIKDHYEARLAQLRIQNDNPSLGPEATAGLRAKIAEVKALIALDQEFPVQIE